MDRTAVSLGGVPFDYPLFVKEYEDANFGREATKRRSAAGSDIVFVREMHTPTITLESRDDGWLLQDTVTQLKAKAETVGDELVLVYGDGSTEQVRFAYEGDILFTPLFDCSLEYKAVLTLVKI